MRMRMPTGKRPRRRKDLGSRLFPLALAYRFRHTAVTSSSTVALVVLHNVQIFRLLLKISVEENTWLSLWTNFSSSCLSAGPSWEAEQVSLPCTISFSVSLQRNSCAYLWSSPISFLSVNTLCGISVTISVSAVCTQVPLACIQSRTRFYLPLLAKCFTAFTKDFCGGESLWV